MFERIRTNVRLEIVDVVVAHKRQFDGETISRSVLEAIAVRLAVSGDADE